MRSGRTADVLGHRVMAPSTLGTFLPAFTFGHLQPAVRGPRSGDQRARLDRSCRLPEDLDRTNRRDTFGGRRLVVRRVRMLDRQGELLPCWEVLSLSPTASSIWAAHRRG